jgi:hypothetical protein
MEKDLIIADIITQELQINKERVVVYSQNFCPPKDDNLYVIISTRIGKPLSSSNKFDKDTNEEVKSVSSFNDYDIEITSRNREAIERKEEIIMAITSTYSIQKQDENSFRLFRAGNIIDLTFIEASSSLNRFRIPVRCTDLKTKRTTVDYFDKLRDNEIDLQRR